MGHLWKWVLGFLAIVLVTFVIAVPFFAGWGRLGYDCGGLGMMRWGSGMMGGWGMLGGLMMLGMLLIPLGVIALFVVLGVTLVRGFNNQKPLAPANLVCQSCGRPVQRDWTICPYCGKPLQ